MLTQDKLLNYAAELQALAQAGLFYSHDNYDLERFARIREIAAELLAEKSGLSLARAKDIYCCETGYQTPKLETRAALFKGDHILLVRENDGSWSLPGGWCEAGLSPGESARKEVREEAGLESEIVKLIAIQDRAAHNPPPSAHPIAKIFVECRALGGSFTPNSETTGSGWFTLDNLPPLSRDRNTEEQIKLCFDAHRDPDWKAQIE